MEDHSSMSDPTETFGNCQLPRTSGNISNLSQTDIENYNDKNEDEKSSQYRNLSENYTKLKTTFSGEKMEEHDNNASFTENMNAKHDMPKTSEKVSNTLEVSPDGSDDAIRKESNSEKKMEEGEDDEYVSSLLSVHFGGGGGGKSKKKRQKIEEKGKQKIDQILGKLYNKHGLEESTQNSKTSSEEDANYESHGVANETGLPIAPDIGNHMEPAAVSPTAATTAHVSRNSPGKTPKVSPKSFVSMFPKVKRQRQRPPPKTSTVYNAELTTIATADQICLNIRMKERKEKHERWKKFPNEKTKYRTKSTRKAEAEQVKKTKGKKGGKAAKQQKKQQEKPEDVPVSVSVSASSSNNSNGADGEFRYHCQFCGMGFAHKSRLKLHERCHTGEKPYPCPFCDKAFSQNGYLKTHLKIHTGEKPFHCSICDYSFRLSTTLNRHMRVHTGECPYTCPVCSRSFNQKSTLSKHLKTHSEDKPYVCEVCKKGFKLIDTLRVHQQIHEGVRSFICSICDKAFKTKGTLLSHMKTHTRNLMLEDGEEEEDEEGMAAMKDDSLCSEREMMDAMKDPGAVVKIDSSCRDDNNKTMALPGLKEEVLSDNETETIALQVADKQSYDMAPTGSESLFRKEEADME